MVQPNRPQMTI